MQALFVGVNSGNALKVAQELRQLGLSKSVTSLTLENSKQVWEYPTKLSGDTIMQNQRLIKDFVKVLVSAVG